MSQRQIIDCHHHVFDPARFPYQADTTYRPAGAELGTFERFDALMHAHDVRHSLIVGPNSGYGTDSRCLLDAIARSGGRCKGIAVVPLDIALDALVELQARGIVGVMFNATFHPVDYFRGAEPLLRKLEQLGMFLQLQFTGDQLLELLPLVRDSGVRLLIDHCGRPIPSAGLGAPGFDALLQLGRSGRAVVKLSGVAKFSETPWPHLDTWPFVRALADAFTMDACVWGSDWPFLRATERIDYGPLIELVAQIFPDERARSKLLWETPLRLFAFA